MSEENTNQVEGNNETNPSTDASKNNDIPYSRFQEVNSEKNELKIQVAKMQERLNEIDASNKAKREERMKKNEEYTTLLAEKDAEIEKLSASANKGTGIDSSRVGAKPQDSGEFGGYSSMEEFAMRDPKGCEAYLESNTKGYIR